MENQKSLFERIGGMTIVNQSVNLFYEKVLADEKINSFFENVDMENQSGKMKAFLAYTFGAPMSAYTGKIMRYAHSRMAINEEHFNAVANHLVDTLKELNIEESMIDEVVAIAFTTKDDVLNN